MSKRRFSQWAMAYRNSILGRRHQLNPILQRCWHRQKGLNPYFTGWNDPEGLRLIAAAQVVWPNANDTLVLLDLLEASLASSNTVITLLQAATLIKSMKKTRVAGKPGPKPKRPTGMKKTIVRFLVENPGIRTSEIVKSTGYDKDDVVRIRNNYRSEKSRKAL